MSQKSDLPPPHKQHLLPSYVIKDCPANFAASIHQKQRSEQKVNKTPLSTKAEHLRPIIGVLVSHWKNKLDGKIIAKNLGTAFALTPFLLMTCTHNVYASCYHRHCDEVLFYPGAQSSQVNSTDYHSKGQPIIRRKQYKDVTFQIKPIKEQLALVRLKEPLKNELNLVFPRIGNFDYLSLPPGETRQVRILGYPIVNKYALFFQGIVNPPKMGFFNESGKVHLYSDYQIDYKVNTTKGLSGSPILAKDQKGEDIVIGIHTHQGRSSGINSGLYFNKEVLQTIREMTQHEEKNIKDLSVIKFYTPDQVFSTQKNEQARSNLMQEWPKRQRKEVESRGQIEEGRGQIEEGRGQIEEGRDLPRQLVKDMAGRSRDEPNRPSAPHGKDEKEKGQKIESESCSSSNSSLISIVRQGSYENRSAINIFDDLEREQPEEAEPSERLLRKGSWSQQSATRQVPAICER